MFHTPRVNNQIEVVFLKHIRAMYSSGVCITLRREDKGCCDTLVCIREETVQWVSQWKEMRDYVID